jgi:hypothetical protein
VGDWCRGLLLVGCQQDAELENKKNAGCVRQSENGVTNSVMTVQSQD